MYKIDYAPPRKNPDNSILLPIRSNTWAHTYSNEGENKKKQSLLQSIIKK